MADALAADVSRSREEATAVDMVKTGAVEGSSAEGASTFEKLLRKLDIAHDFSPSVSPQQARRPPPPA